MSSQDSVPNGSTQTQKQRQQTQQIEKIISKIKQGGLKSDDYKYYKYYSYGYIFDQ